MPALHREVYGDPMFTNETPVINLVVDGLGTYKVYEPFSRVGIFGPETFIRAYSEENGEIIEGTPLSIASLFFAVGDLN